VSFKEVVTSSTYRRRFENYITNRLALELNELTVVQFEKVFACLDESHSRSIPAIIILSCARFERTTVKPTLKPRLPFQKRYDRFRVMTSRLTTQFSCLGFAIMYRLAYCGLRLRVEQEIQTSRVWRKKPTRADKYPWMMFANSFLREFCCDCKCKCALESPSLTHSMRWFATPDTWHRSRPGGNCRLKYSRPKPMRTTSKSA